MPFALTEYDEAFGLFLRDTVRELARARSPILAEIRFEEQSGPVASRIRTREGGNLDLPEEVSGFEVTTSLEAIRGADYDEFTIEVDRAADEVKDQLESMMIRHLDAVTTTTGNVFDAGGKLTFEKIYEMLDGLEWGLTDEGELSVPSLLVHPDALKNLPPETPEQKLAMEELKQRKYEEAIARRGSRRLS